MSNQIDITPKQTEDFTAELSSPEVLIDTFLPDETEGDICFWASKLRLVSTLTTLDFSVKSEIIENIDRNGSRSIFR